MISILSTPRAPGPPEKRVGRGALPVRHEQAPGGDRFEASPAPTFSQSAAVKSGSSFWKTGALAVALLAAGTGAGLPGLAGTAWAAPAAACAAGSPATALSADSPQLMVGVPAAFLTPGARPPASGNVPRVGIELEPGLGLSLDGRALLVGANGTLSEQNLLQNVSGKAVHISRQGGDTVVGDQAHPGFRLTQTDGHVSATGSSDGDSFQAQVCPAGADLQSPAPARSYTVRYQPGGASVQPGWSGGISYSLQQDGATTRITTGHPQADLTVTRQGDGSVSVRGALNSQNFLIRRGDDGLSIQGYYPQQSYTLRSQP